MAQALSDFVSAAWPWVAIGIAIIAIVVHGSPRHQ